MPGNRPGVSRPFCQYCEAEKARQRRSKIETFDRLFISLLLESCRDRKQKIKGYEDEIETLKKAESTAKEELSVHKALFTIEKKRNSDLESEVAVLDMELSELRKSCEELKYLVSDVKDEKDALRSAVLDKTNENTRLRNCLVRSYTELQEVINNERQIEKNLAETKNQVHCLLDEQIKLIDELTKIRKESDKSNLEFKRKLSFKCNELQESLQKLFACQHEYDKVSNEEREVERNAVSDLEVARKLADLHDKIERSRISNFNAQEIIATSSSNIKRSALAQVLSIGGRCLGWISVEIIIPMMLSTQSTPSDTFILYHRLLNLTKEE